VAVEPENKTVSEEINSEIIQADTIAFEKIEQMNVSQKLKKNLIIREQLTQWKPAFKCLKH